MSQAFSTTAFIQSAIEKGVLKFGEFTLKSGRVSPYFFNAGLLNDGSALSLLANGYAQQLAKQSTVDVVFGPAYKGIPLAAASAAALWNNHAQNVAWGYNRKEAKDQGEGGILVGADVAGKNVWIVDDVITAGTAIREVIRLLTHSGATVAGVVVALDRQEKGQHNLSAIQEIEQEFNIPVVSLVCLSSLMDYLQDNNQQAELDTMRIYREQYGI